MKETVLLARPHQMIVADMKRFLCGIGFSPEPVNDIQELRDFDIKRAVGSVISMTSVSAEEFSIRNVFKEVRRQEPNLPIIFSTLMDFPMAERVLKGYVGPMVEGLRILPVSAATLQEPDLGSTNVMVCVLKNQIKDADVSELTRDIFLRHFQTN